MPAADTASAATQLFRGPVPANYAAAIDSAAARPLFAETRRKPLLIQATAEPPVAEPTPVPEVIAPEPIAPELEERSEPEHPKLDFRGYVESDGTVQVLMYHNHHNQEIWLTAGDTVDGWSVTSITKDAIEFENSGFEWILKVEQ